MNKGMAMVAIDELKKAREEAIKFAQETDNAIVMLIGNTLGDRDDAEPLLTLEKGHSYEQP